MILDLPSFILGALACLGVEAAVLFAALVAAATAAGNLHGNPEPTRERPRAPATPRPAPVPDKPRQVVLHVVRCPSENT